MNAEELLRHYDRVADAPEAVTRLRRFVLDLAVRGKLAPQVAEDGSASQLLRRIFDEKARLVLAGELSKPKPLPAIEEAPYVLPESWTWVRIREVTADRGQTIPKLPFTYIDVTSIDKEVGAVADPKTLTPDEAPSRARKLARKGDVIYSCVRPYLLNVAVIESDFDPPPIVSTAFAVLNGFGLVLPRYIWIVLRSPPLVAAVEEDMRGQAYPAINDAEFSLLPFPLPPLAEQHRIVAKVDELMALCDRLEAARAEREAARDRLTAASLARLNTPDPETYREDVRFVLNTLPALAVRVTQIRQLRASILRLALRGSLVRQSPDDEPASRLLDLIHSRRHRLLESGYPNAEEARTQAKKQAEQRLPGEVALLPDGWAWATLMQCSLLVVDCKNKTAPYASSGIRLLRTTNVRDGRLNSIDQRFVTPATYAAWSARCEPAPGDILITREAPMGEVCLIPAGEKVCLGQRMMLIRLVDDTIDPAFMLYSLRDPDLLSRVQDKPIGATVQHLRVGGIETLMIPLPPLAEQRRIIAKLDELMAICDRLEAELTSAEGHRERLLEALLHEALQPAELMLEVA